MPYVYSDIVDIPNISPPDRQTEWGAGTAYQIVYPLIPQPATTPWTNNWSAFILINGTTVYAMSKAGGVGSRSFRLTFYDPEGPGAAGNPTPISGPAIDWQDNTRFTHQITIYVTNYGEPEQYYLNQPYVGSELWFETHVRPTEPYSIYPTNGATGAGNGPNFIGNLRATWSSESDLDNGGIHFQTSSFTPTAVGYSYDELLAYDMSALGQLTLYYWAIQVIRNGYYNYSNCNTFTTDAYGGAGGGGAVTTSTSSSSTTTTTSSTSTTMSTTSSSTSTSTSSSSTTTTTTTVYPGYTDGQVKSVAVIPGTSEDEVWVIVQRVIKGATVYYVEQMQPRLYSALEDAWYVDCGIKYDSTPTTTLSGLGHLEGERVAILADGVVQTAQIVPASGSLTLPSFSVAIAGLPYRYKLQPMRFDVSGAGFGTSKGSVKRFAELVISFYQTANAKYGVDTSNLFSITWPSSGTYDGDKVVHHEGGFDVEDTVIITGIDPMPCTVRAMIPRLNKTGR